MKPYAPLGILYLSAHLRSKGIRGRDFRYHVSLALRICLAILDAGPPSVIGIYGNLMTRRTVLELTARRAGGGVDRRSGRPGTADLCAGISGGRRPCHRARRGRAHSGGTPARLASRRRGGARAGQRHHIPPPGWFDGTHSAACPGRRSGLAPVARPGTRRHRRLYQGVERASRHGLGLGHNRPGMPLSLPLVQPLHLRKDSPAAIGGMCGG